MQPKRARRNGRSRPGPRGPPGPGFNQLDRDTFGLILNKLGPGHRNKSSLALATKAHSKNALASARPDQQAAAKATRAMEAAVRKIGALVYQAAAYWRKMIPKRYFVIRRFPSWHGYVKISRDIFAFGVQDLSSLTLVFVTSHRINNQGWVTARSRRFFSARMYFGVRDGQVAIHRVQRMHGTAQNVNGIKTTLSRALFAKAVVQGAIEYYRQRPVEA